MATGNGLLRSWLLDKYARFVPSDRQGKGEWKYFSSYGGSSQMKISLIEPLKLLITSGSAIVLESIPLYGSDKEPTVKAICKGDSMLFFTKVKDCIRRFRIRFAKGTHQSEKENCQEFLQEMADYIHFKTIDPQEDDGNSQQASQSLLNDSSQNHLNQSLEFEYAPPSKMNKSDPTSSKTVSDAKIFSAMSVRQIAESLMKNSIESFPECYKTTNALPMKDVDSMVRSCLLDPDFPAFVGQVEESFKKILSDE